MMKKLPLWLNKILGNKEGAIRTLVQIAVFIGAVLLPVGIFHMICPMGGIATLTRFFSQGLFIPKTSISNFIILGAVLLVTIIAGPVFCGWICPLGSVQDWVRSLSKKLKIKRLTVPRYINTALSLLRFGVLALVIFATAKSLSLMFMRLDPYYALMHFWTGEVFPLSILILALTLILSLFIDRPWCRWFCPLGAVLSVIGKISIFKIKKPSSKCINCGSCHKACPVGLHPEEKESVTDIRCIRCGLCTPSCPPKVRTNKTNFIISFVSALFLLVVFFTVPIFTQKSSGTQAGGEITMNTTIQAASENLGISEKEILIKLGLPPTYETDTKLIDIEDDYEDITWTFIKDVLVE
ncbi:MAG TPA: 4Fe-4S binding protein [Treponemataceae bacterium]|nr:4Fe-4S binding protein [Treponemataceae bacterium]